MSVELYVVRNRDGHYFRAKGYGGSGNSWVKEIEKAKVYTRIAPARATVSFFACKHPSFGTPQLVRLVVTQTAVVVDETERVEKVKRAKATAKETAEKRHAAYRLKQAQETLDAAEKNLAAAKAKKR